MENNQGFQTVDREFSWDDEIVNDSNEWILLPDGEYPYVVTNFERARHPGSAKLPPCKMAILTLSIDGGAAGTTTVTHRLFLHSKCEGLLSAFFESIGQKKHGEPLRMNWQTVIGAKGRCKLEIHNYTGNDGTEKQSNQVKRFLPPEEPKAAPVQQTWAQGKF